MTVNDFLNKNLRSDEKLFKNLMKNLFLNGKKTINEDYKTMLKIEASTIVDNFVKSNKRKKNI
jgi:hypothetical protein